MAAASDVVFTIVGFPDDVHEVVLGDDGVVAHLAPGGVLVDMTSSRPSLAVEIADGGGGARRARTRRAGVGR